MYRTAFNFELPPELIAQTPLPERSASRLLELDGASGAIRDRRFVDLVQWLEPGDLVVLNDTRVLPARLKGQKATGGRVELLLERLLDERAGRFQLRSSKSPKTGSTLQLDGGAVATVVGRAGALFDLTFDRALEPWLRQHGAVPLPPYIDREPEAGDADRYQTVFADVPGAVAAPTAGLHFDAALLDEIRSRGVALGKLTLHVGAGTFSPVRTERIEDHRLHSERVEISELLCRQLRETTERGGRVVAIGTTTVRALEAAATAAVAANPAAGRPAHLAPFSGETDIFIYPGFRFRVVDAIVTNFHLPKSSLLLLVSALIGERWRDGYSIALREGYRFYSYGDAMLIV